MSAITLEFLRDLLKDDYPDVIIQEYKEAPGSKRGDNYTSMVYRITLKGVRHTTEAGDASAAEQPWEGSIIYKCLPESILRRETFKSDELFCNEAAFYNKIWPALNDFQGQWDKVKFPFKSLPKCYLAQSDIVILKDLNQMGFVMPDRRQGLSIEQCYFVLKHLSHFHSLSMAMKYENPEGFYELLNLQDGISEVFFVEENKEYYRAYFAEAIRNAIAMIEEELKDSEERDVYLSRFRDFCELDKFFETLIEIVVPREPMAVICHGDCWTNNFLFKYVAGDIAELCMVDFQMARYTSPGVDLVYLLYLCLERHQRSEHLASLLEYYSEQLHARLVEMSSPDSVFHTTLTRDALYELVQQEFRRCSHYGLGMALDMYPVMTCDSDEAPNLYQAKEAAIPSHDEMAPVITSNEACRRKMGDLVRELVDLGWL